MLNYLYIVFSSLVALATCKAQEVTTEQYCLKESFHQDYLKIHNSRDDRLSSCPKLYRSVLFANVLAHQHFVCNHTANAPAWEPQLMVPMNRFLDKLNDTGSRILVVGDSLSGQMQLELLCHLELEGGWWTKDNYPLVLKFFASRFLAPLKSPYFLEPRVVSEDEFGWVTYSKENNITHIVLNTGAWWEHGRVRKRMGDGNLTLPLQRPEAVNVFNLMFTTPGWPLFDAIQDLTLHNGIHFIWRDITASGVCHFNPVTGESSMLNEGPIYWDSRGDHVAYNNIARQAITKQGGSVIEGIYTESLTNWQNHPILSMPEQRWIDGNVSAPDSLHWCLFSNASMPLYWIYKLHAHLFPTSPRIDSSSV